MYRFLPFIGQNITDLLKYTDGKSAHELMERTIDYGHIFPTVPDTIDGFPFQDRDPLVFDDIPHVYFIGNQENFQRSVVEKDNGAKTLFLSIPVFSRTK
jgi:DNA polymerase delta subunit 2